MQDEQPTAAHPFPVSEVGSRYRVWTWAGTVRNRSLLANCRSLGALSAGPWSVDFQRHPGELCPELALHSPEEGDPLLKPLAEALKFAELLPRSLLLAELSNRCFETGICESASTRMPFGGSSHVPLVKL